MYSCTQDTSRGTSHVHTLVTHYKLNTITQGCIDSYEHGGVALHCKLLNGLKFRLFDKCSHHTGATYIDRY